MEPRISIITIATDDLDRAVRFYEAMGLTRHAGITEGVAFFQMGGAILGLFPRKDAEADSGVQFAKAPSAVYLAYNTRSDAEVDEVLAAAERAGGRIVKPAGNAPSGAAGTAISPTPTAMSGKSRTIRLSRSMLPATFRSRADYRLAVGGKVALRLD